MPSKRTLCICIVNWNTGDQLRDCIASIERARKTCFDLTDVVIVDNGSDDGSLAGLDSYDVPLKVMKNKMNRGFAAACNQAAEVGKGDFLLFLNPDTRLHEDSLDAPMAFMSHPEGGDVGICGIQMVDGSGKDCISYATFPTLGKLLLQTVGLSMAETRQPLSLHNGNQSVLEVDQVIGAFFLTTRSLFQSLNGFDEQFFVYYEEVDFSMRARKKGFRNVCLKHVTCMHVGGGSSSKVKSQRLFYSLRSRLLYGFKHFNLCSALVLLFVSAPGEFIARLSHAMFRGSWDDMKFTMQGYIMLVKDMPAIWRRAMTQGE